MKTETRLAALTLGMTEAAIARYDTVALAIGPKTTLPNDVVYDTTWRIGLEALKRGASLLPTNADHWAGELWAALVMLGEVRSHDVNVIQQIRDAARAAWAEE